MKVKKEENEKRSVSRKISDFLYEEEGNISRGKILTIGSLMLVAGILFSNYVFAAHRSHSSHSSHSSHRSGSGSHYSHQSHQSHTSSSTHTSHSSTSAPATHSNVHSSLPTFQTPQDPRTMPMM